jgi:predicted MFS family arabinose efflux permease
MEREQRVHTVAALGSAQTVAWASSYYLPAMLAAPIASELRISTPTVFAAFSLALIVSALLGPYAGRAIDRWGGRSVLIGTNVVFALGLASLGFAQGAMGLFAAWVIIGIAMGSGLYEAAFAALVRLYGHDSRNVITGITLIAGFASTLGWPLSTFLETQVGWRGACFTWAMLHLLIGIPLNWSLPESDAPAPITNVTPTVPDVPISTAQYRSAVLLAFVFAVTWFTSTAMAAHLPRLLQAGGVAFTTAVALGALIGPAQVGGRLLELGVLRRLHPLFSARLAALLHPVGATLFLLLGAPAAAVFVILHGAGNGILTIANGTLPLVLFGPRGYGHRQGMLMVPSRIAQALAPWLFGLLLNQWGANVMWLSGLLGMMAFGALLMLPHPETSET